MAKKKIEVEEVREALPSDNIVTNNATDEWAFQPVADTPSSEMAWSPTRVVEATTLPEKPKVDVNKVLFEMIALMGTVESFDSQARILRAVAAYYNLSDEFSG
jgi:hypothetical protein